MRRVWQRFRRLSRLERGMFFRAFFLLPATVAALRFANLLNVERLMDLRGKRDSLRAVGDAEGNWRVAEVARRMTEAASRYGVVGGNCLSKSIVLCHLLRRQGLDATLRVGGRKDSWMFEAHAWVELGGRAINDSADVQERFAPFEGHVRGALSAEMTKEK
jgi:hypothetical protein